MNVKLLLADDHRILRQGLRALLEAQPDFQVVGEASNGREALEMVQEMAVDVVIIDIGMPNLNGIEATRRIRALKPNMKILALSMHADLRFVVEILKAGASGYVVKDAAFDELVGAIRSILLGTVYLSPAVAGAVVDSYLKQGSAASPSVFSSISTREREVLQLMAEGKATKEIALILHVSSKTIETHRRQIMTKLDLHSVAELTKYAIREGLTSLDLTSAPN